MKIHFITILIILLAACSAEKENSTKDTNSVDTTVDEKALDPAQSQMGLQLSQEVIYDSLTKQMNLEYTKIVKNYSDNPAFLKNLKTAQEAWLVYKDAQIMMKYPENDPSRETSSFNMCLLGYVNDLLRERIATLKAWNEGENEGYMCSGSVKLKSELASVKK